MGNLADFADLDSGNFDHAYKERAHSMTQLTLDSQDLRAVLEPSLGGSIASLTWRGRDLFHPRRGETVLDGGMFCLVPFSNRIAGSTFAFDGIEVRLEPNHPTMPNEPVLHGFGWVSEWDIVSQSSAMAELCLDHEAGEWPWSFRAEQCISIFEDRVRFELSLTNLDRRPMPAGLGFHPYFPRNSATRYLGFHTGEWQTGSDGLPISLEVREDPTDWWSGLPVGARDVDTVYSGRSGDLLVEWEEQSYGVRIAPSDDLRSTTLYVPRGADFFCVEPVSHGTNAINRGNRAEMKVLAPREGWSTYLELIPYEGSLIDRTRSD